MVVGFYDCASYKKNSRLCIFKQWEDRGSLVTLIKRTMTSASQLAFPLALLFQLFVLLMSKQLSELPSRHFGGKRSYNFIALPKGGERGLTRFVPINPWVSF